MTTPRPDQVAHLMTPEQRLYVEAAIQAAVTDLLRVIAELRGRIENAEAKVRENDIRSMEALNVLSKFRRDLSKADRLTLTKAALLRVAQANGIHMAENAPDTE